MQKSMMLLATTMQSIFFNNDMKRIFCIAAFLIAVVSCVEAPSDRAEKLRDMILNGTSDYVIVVAHRGDWREVPENSIASIEHSIATGVDVVEVDLQMTKDSVLVLMHDETVDRTTTGIGRVADFTLDSLQRLNLKHKGEVVPESFVPTLEQAMLAAKGKVLINLDKADRYFDLVVPVLEKTGTARQIIMKGGRTAESVLELYGQYLDDIIYMPVVNFNNDSAEELIKGHMSILKPCAYELVYGSEELEDYLIQLKEEIGDDALIWYNTLWASLCAGHDDALALQDPDKAYGYLIDTLGADIIQTDRAEYLLEYLRARGMHD